MKLYFISHTMFWTLDEKEEQGLDSVYSELRSYLRQLSNSETTDAYDSLDRVNIIFKYPFDYEI